MSYNDFYPAIFHMMVFIGLSIAISPLIGACIGSFIAARVIRSVKGLPQNLWGRSACLHCHTALSARDLVPIFSFLLHKGKCRHCKTPYSSAYMWIELVTAVLFTLSTVLLLAGLLLASPESFPALQGVQYVSVIAYFSTLSLLIYICSVDILILAFPVRMLGIFTLLHLLMGVFGIDEDILSRLGGLVFFVVLLGGIRAIGGWMKKTQVMGTGDLWLGALIGASLGLVGSIIAFYVSFIVGALVALGMMLILGRKKVLGKALPFGPFLCLGWFIAYFFSKPLFALLFPIL